MQLYLQTVAHHFYANFELPALLRDFAYQAWDQLEAPDIPAEGLPGFDVLNVFRFDHAWLLRRKQHLQDILAELEVAATGGQPTASVYLSYRTALKLLAAEDTEQLCDYLRRYLKAMDSVDLDE